MQNSNFDMWKFLVVSGGGWKAKKLAPKIAEMAMVGRKMNVMTAMALIVSESDFMAFESCWVTRLNAFI